MSEIINGVHYYQRESDAKEAFAVIPTGKEGSGVSIAVHGIGEISAGAIANLRNLVEGMDLDNNPATPGEYPLATKEWKATLAAKDHIGVVVNYTSAGLTPTDFDYIKDTVLRDFKADPARVSVFCFSLGGQQVIPMITSSVERAKQYALVWLAAPVNPGGRWQNVVDAKLQVIGSSVATDKRVSSSNVKNAVSAINALNPSIKALYIEWPGEGHGTFNEALAGTDPRIPQHPLDYVNSLKGERKQYPNTATLPKPVEPVPTTPSTDVVADFNIKNNQVITTTSFELDASASKGAKSYYWKVERAEPPFGVGPKWDGGTVGGPKKKISGLTAGMHTVQLEINGSVKSDVRVFVVRPSGDTEPEPTPKTVVSVSAAKIVFSDGTTADSAGWKLVGKSGEEYVL